MFLNEDILNKTKNQFIQDIESIASALIKLYQLRFSQDVKELSRPISRWLDFRMRYIEPKPREISLSKTFPHIVNEKIREALRILVEKSYLGQNLNPYQSKTLQRNDVSGGKIAQRIDSLWADWGIHHIHLTDLPVESVDGFSERSAWLLFFIVLEGQLLLIDIKKHNALYAFSDISLLKSVKASWPEYMSRYKLYGFLPSSENITNEEVAICRKNKLNTMLTLDGEVYISPGMGVTCANTSTKVIRIENDFFRWINWLAEEACAKNGQIIEKVTHKTTFSPEFSLGLTEQGLAVYEKNSDMAFTFHNGEGNSDDLYCKAMHDLIFPDWVKQKYMNYIFNEST